MIIVEMIGALSIAGSAFFSRIRFLKKRESGPLRKGDTYNIDTREEKFKKTWIFFEGTNTKKIRGGLGIGNPEVSADGENGGAAKAETFGGAVVT